jgi:hypothetical protein
VAGCQRACECVCTASSNAGGELSRQRDSG